MAARRAAVAGRFYPAEPAVLAAQVAAFLGTPVEGEVVPAVVAPHAGYMYSGRIAGAVYRAIHVPDTVVVLCPNHTGAGARASVITRGGFATPMGEVPIHDELAELVTTHCGLTDDARAHAGEHAIEVHLPFLLARNPRVRFVPVCLGGHGADACLRMGLGLADAITAFGAPVLMVASTDMSHYISAADAARLDRLALERVEALDPAGLHETVVLQDISMCGFIPTTVVLAAARKLGASGARLVEYGHSGETTGDLDHVVGYAGLVIR